jgi:hypothetical protein
MDMGDGSAGTNYFSTEALARKSAEMELKHFGYSLQDNIEKIDFDKLPVDGLWWEEYEE